VDRAFFSLLTLLGFMWMDVDQQGKKLTAINDHSEQIRSDAKGRFDDLEQTGTKTLREVEYMASRMQSLEAELELLRKHLMPDNRRPWDA
jgi:hypothetical protein